MSADRTLSGFMEFWQLQILSMLLKQFTQQSSDIHGDCLNYVEGRHGKSSIDWYALAAQSDACPTGDQKVAVSIYRGQVRQHSFVEIDHVIRFTTSLFLLLIEEGQFPVFLRTCTSIDLPHRELAQEKNGLVHWPAPHDYKSVDSVAKLQRKPLQCH